jgi:hypothetical protein
MIDRRITGLTPLNVKAIRELPELDGLFDTTATTASLTREPAWVLERLNATIASLVGRGHPRSSLYAVVRKVNRIVELERTEAAR